MTKKTIDADTILNRARPLVHQHAHEIQPYGHLVRLPIALSEHACKESVENLNQLLADTMTLRDLYKKHHWQVAGPTFYQLHLLFDKHYEQQNELVDTIAERIQLLGGVSLAMAHDISEITLGRAASARESRRTPTVPERVHRRRPDRRSCRARAPVRVVRSSTVLILITSRSSTQVKPRSERKEHSC